MEHHHSFPKALAVGLAMACLASAQYACQAEAPDQAAAGERLDAAPAQGAGDGGVHWSYERRDRPGPVGWAGSLLHGL